MPAAASIYSSGEYLEANNTWHVEDSPWKADQIHAMLRDCKLKLATVAEVGCGAGEVLAQLARKPDMRDTMFAGYDVSPQAIELARPRTTPRLSYFCSDMFANEPPKQFDLLLVIDVFEHVPDYWGFVSKCRAVAEYKIYHIPIDIHVSSVLRDTSDHFRKKLGHIHLFTAASALATLRDTGHEILSYRYTNGASGLFWKHPSLRRALVNIPRSLIGLFSVPLAARIFGGYSLLVLTK